MSFDVYFQAFRDGREAVGGADRMHAVLEPYVMHRASELSFLLVEVGDGEADVYLDDDGMMANHVSGDDPWEVLFLGARAADWVVMGVGAACLTEESQRAHLPTELRADAVVVGSGAELVAVLVGSEHEAE